MKRLRWEIRYWIASVALVGFVRFVRFIPFAWSFSLIEGIGTKIAWHLAGKYKKKMLDNLTISYHGSLAGEEKERIATESFRNMLRGFVETFYAVHFYDKEFNPRIQIVGRQNLEEALAHGKGAIAVSAHLGTFTLIGAKLANSGFQLTWILGGQSHPRLAHVWRWMGECIGMRFIIIDSLFRFHKEILRVLRRGEVMGFICDENQKQGGVPVKFLGRVMALPVGPAVYHLKTGAPILPMFIVRQNNGGHKVIIDPPLKVTLSGDETRDVFAIVAQIARVMEYYIKKYPGQWSWIAKRRIRTRTRRQNFLEKATPLT